MGTPAAHGRRSYGDRSAGVVLRSALGWLRRPGAIGRVAAGLRRNWRCGDLPIVGAAGDRQALLGIRTSPSLRYSHLISTFVTLAASVPHILIAWWRRRRSESSRGAAGTSFHLTTATPSARIRYARCLRMDAFARQYVRQLTLAAVTLTRSSPGRGGADTLLQTPAEHQVRHTG